MAFAGIDIDKPGKYPIVLSDALLGKTTKEVYTGMRYNHKPDTSADSSSSTHLKPSDSGSNTFDLSYKDNKDKYSYQGVRVSGDGKYVLIYDPQHKHFVLHRIDSTFDMNLVSAPWDQDASSLKDQYTQISTQQTINTTAAQPPKRKPSKAKATTTKAEPAKPRKKVEKVTKPKPPPRAPTPDEEEEESDAGLDIEDPDGGAPVSYQYHPSPTFQRQDSEDASEEDSDAEGEEYEDERNKDVDDLKLPSPANNTGGVSEEDDMELDLEAELEQAFAGDADDSSESEEE
ncbi:hypothetical protein GLAREA_02484 [Glarea lozoyensis ATCC 20868]|uniref:Transcription elongation factor Eaf N-terminal domain-containing protein n=2 Tax=Glarea lozoyensis TaxID=101852 RepID=S3D3C4_GLAL2|nr:uncharacterized protein GLAREA_02484 [Glarea lozoyensis ATCC 20868]EHL00927.1 putative Neurogenic locus notch like protein 2 [Glarea lozoyensis 74030]EPE26571.1 hypothetical protein GLAREA_02484 [Glarea lozoyensis ATCC 20868]